MFYVAGPGHAGPALVANTYLEGTYSEVYPDIGRDEAGLEALESTFASPAEYLVTSRRPRRARFMREASLGSNDSPSPVVTRC